MTVLDVPNKERYTADGSQTNFPFSFKVFDEDEVKVLLKDTNGIESEATGYTVSLVDDGASGGSIEFATAPASGYVVVVYSDFDYTQELELTNASPFKAESINDTHDKMVLEVRQLREEVSRCMKVPLTDPSDIDTEMPTIDNRKNKFLYFDDDGNISAGAGVTTVIIDTFMEPFLQKQDVAQAQEYLELTKITAVDTSSDVPTSNAVKTYVDNITNNMNIPPVGTIIPVIRGYFGDSSNGSFIAVGTNDVDYYNARYNSQGWYVCDGSEINVVDSAFYNGPGRHLPNLTDTRFIAGYSAAGTVNGNNSITHSHNTADHVLTIDEMPSHNHSGSTNTTGNHSHSITGTMVDAAGGAQHSGPGDFNDTSFNTSSTGSHSHTVSIGNRGGGQAHNHGDTEDTIIDNRPAFLTAIYLIRVF